MTETRITSVGHVAAASACLAAVAACLATVLPARADAPPPQGFAAKLISYYHMQRVPEEGPWFSLSYSSEDSIDGDALPARYAGRTHAAGSAIVAVETAADFSAMHRLQTDEVWHFYGGSPIDMLLLYPDGHGRKVRLGADVLAGELPQFTVPRGVWQGSAPHGQSPQRYSLFGDQLSPGFDYADFEMGYRDALDKQYPVFARDIERLTRGQFAAAPRKTLNELSASDAPSAPDRESPPPPGAVFSSTDVPVQQVSDGVSLQELVGNVARYAKTNKVSVAQFTLAPGHSSGTSFNHHSQEIFLVTSGTGLVHLDTRNVSVGPGSTVFIPAREPHSIEAASTHELIFLAISAPAFTPADYVAVKP
jgi:predicted cupin superfamily sugar epimerase/mannose-6-phosphate isomerase-like protein (cupin superfamily)